MNMNLQQKMNNPIAGLKEARKELQYTANGYSYLFLDSSDNYISSHQVVCDFCNKSISHGYLVWLNHVLVCDKCFKKYDKLPNIDSETKKLQEDITSHLWYLSYVDEDVQAQISKKMLLDLLRSL